MQDKLQHIQDARRLMRSLHSGVLATNSLSVKGFPFGSVVPFLLTEEGDLVIYASDIAQHSRNMKADAKVSLCAYDSAQADSQASARVTLLAHAFADAVDDDLQKMYFQLFPQAKAYVEAHDFRFYSLKTERVRYIGGFGEIYWFNKDDWTDSLLTLAAQSKGIIQHMHDDHADALAEVANHFTHFKAKEGEVRMLSCYSQGFHFAYQSHIGFIPFLHEVGYQYDVRKAMVDLTRAARLDKSVLI